MIDNYNEIFGIETQEAPAETETAEGAAEETAVEETPAEEAAEKTAEAPEEKQSAEDNAKYAAMRRKYEAERDQAVQQERERLVNLIKSAGLTDPITNVRVETPEQLEAYRDHAAEQKRVRELRKSGLDEQKFRELAMELPEYRAAERKAAEAEAKLRQAEDINAQTRIDDQLKAIQALDPSIKSMDDLVRADGYDKIYSYVSRGYSIEEAYKLANFDRILQNQGKAQKQAAINAANSKTHLERTEARGSGSEPVPDSVKAEYRNFVPNATDAEIAKHYNAYIKK